MRKETLIAYLDLIENKYFNLYWSLIENNLTTKKEKYKTQLHHIIPKYYFIKKSLIVDNSTENTINLSYTDHLKAHIYLALCSTKKEDRYANFCAITKLLGEKYLEKQNLKTLLENITKNIPEYASLYKESQEFKGKLIQESYSKKSISEKEEINQKRKQNISKLKTYHKNDYEIRIVEDEIPLYVSQGFLKGRALKNIKAVKEKSVFKKGKTPWNKGLKQSIEAKEKRKNTIRQKELKGYVYPKSSNEKKTKISLKNKGKIYIYKQNEIKKIYHEELNKYINEGWFKGNPNAKKGSLGKIMINDGLKNYMLPKEKALKLLETNKYKKGALKNTKNTLNNTIWVNNGEYCVRIKQEELEYYINKGFKKGFLNKR